MIFRHISWGVRYIIFPVLLGGVILAALAGYLSYHDARIEAFLSAGENAGQGSINDSDDHDDDSIAIPPPPSLPIIPVHSYPPGNEYPLLKWQIINDPSGFIDWVIINEQLVDISSKITVRPGDVIEIGGWAGHRLLGMRFPEVLLSVCDLVFASVPVNGVRQDVAEAIHPNLMYSGWEAKLYANDFPMCDNAVISAWGRPPVGDTLRPLSGKRRVAFSDQIVKSKLIVAHETPVIHPDNIPQADPVSLDVLLNDTNVHRCASTACKVVAKLPGGPLKAVLIEEMDGWYLLQSAMGSGWVLSTTIVVLP